MMNVAKYRKWCLETKHVPLFAQAWWLDAVCGIDNWSVACLDHDEVTILLPYFQFRSKGLSRVTQPHWTQYSFLTSSNLEPFKRDFSIEEILSALPRASVTELNFAPGQIRLNKNQYHTDLRQRITFHVIPTEGRSFRQGYSKNLKRNLKRARQMYNVEECVDFEPFVTLVQKSFDRRGTKSIHQESMIRLLTNLKERNQGRILVAKNNHDVVVGGVCVCWDDSFTYYIMGGQVSSSGLPSPHSILLDEAIEESLSAQRTFDFCGSMIPGIQRFFRSFGGEEKTYEQIQKYRGLGLIKKYLSH